MASRASLEGLIERYKQKEREYQEAKAALMVGLNIMEPLKVGAPRRAVNGDGRSSPMKRGTITSPKSLAIWKYLSSGEVRHRSDLVKKFGISVVSRLVEWNKYGMVESPERGAWRKGPKEPIISQHLLGSKGKVAKKERGGRAPCSKAVLDKMVAVFEDGGEFGPKTMASKVGVSASIASRALAYLAANGRIRRIGLGVYKASK